MKTFEEREEYARLVASSFTWLLRNGPLEPMASRAEVLDLACPSPGCGAAPSEECRTEFPHPAFTAGAVLGVEWRDVHLRRYLDKTGDPR